MKISETFSKAMTLAIEDLGSQRRLAYLSGLTSANISKYMAGEIRNMRVESWQKLEPILKHYMTREEHLSVSRKFFRKSISSEVLHTTVQGTTDTQISAAEMLKFWLKSKGHTQTSVAQLLGITQQAIQAQLSGKTKLTAAIVHHYAEILNIPEKATQEIIAALHNGDASLAAAINNLAAAISKLADTMEVAK